MKRHGFVTGVLAATVAGSLALSASAQPVTMTVDAGKPGAPISRYMYGFFTELTRNCYEGGLWAEMLGDARDSMFSPLSCAQAINEMFRHSNRFVISAYTAAPELLEFTKTDAIARPIGLMFELYRWHFGTIPLDVAGNSPQHEVKGTVGVDKAKTSSGSDTYPLDAAAALTAGRKSLTFAIVNPTESARRMDVALKGVAVQNQGRLWRIAAADLTAANTPGKPPVVGIVESPLSEAPGRLAIPPISISIYEYPVR